jgi:hypothetical protein
MNWRLMAHNYVGVPTDELVCLLQHLEDSPWMLCDERWSDWAELTVDAIGCELKKREGMQVQPEATTNPHIIATLKATLGNERIVEVVSWYAEVYVHNKTYTFRCPSAPTQKTPSGNIYPDQGSWWCFRCGHGGDALDAIQLLGNKSKGEAISALGKYLGIDTRPRGRKVGGYAV